MPLPQSSSHNIHECICCSHVLCSADGRWKECSTSKPEYACHQGLQPTADAHRVSLAPPVQQGKHDMPNNYRLRSGWHDLLGDVFFVKEVVLNTR